MLRIRLFCNQGMSTSLLVNAMKKAAEEEKLDVDIKAYPINELDAIIKECDCALLGPQVGYTKEKSQKIGNQNHVPVDVIPMRDYGMCNGKNVLAFAKELAAKTV